MQKAITYVRRSTDMQEASLEDQRRSIREYAQNNNLRIITEFCDDAISGKTVKARPGFQGMIDFARTSEEDYTLLVYDVSRFGRFENPKEATYWEVELERNGVHVNYVTEGFQNDGSLGSFVTKIVKDAEASEYIKKLAKLSRRGIKSCSERGYWTGSRAPFGYARAVVEPTTGEIERVLRSGEQNPIRGKRIKLVPDEENIEIVRTIFDLYANREQGMFSITRYLYEQGIPSPTGRPHWHKTSLRNILKNLTYTGVISINRGKEGEVITENAHEAIIDRDTFERAQERMQKAKFGRGGGYVTPYLLTKLIKCGNCEGNLHGITHSSTNRRGYRCNSNSNIGGFVCGGRYYTASYLEQPVLDNIVSQVQSDGWEENVRLAVNYAIGEDGRSLTSRLEKVQSEYDQNRGRMQNLLEAIADGLPRKTAIQAVQKIEERQDDLEDIIATIEAKQQTGTRYQQTADFLYGLPSDWEGSFEQATPQEKKRIVRMFLEKATIDDSERRVTYNFYEFPYIAEDQKPPRTTQEIKDIRKK